MTDTVLAAPVKPLPPGRGRLRLSLAARSALLGAMLALVGLNSPVRSQAPAPLPGDPVEDLRRTIDPRQDPFVFPNYKEGKQRAEAERFAHQIREETLKQFTDEKTTPLKSLGSLSRALLLEWPRDPLDWRLAFREQLAEMFRKGLREALRSNDPHRMIAAAGVLGEFFQATRSSPSTAPVAIMEKLVDLTPELKALTEHGDCLVRAAGVVALAQVSPATKEVGPVFRKMLADPEVYVRRATARALREQIEFMVRQVTAPAGRGSAAPMPERGGRPELLPEKPARRPGSKLLQNDPPDFLEQAVMLLETFSDRPCTGLTDKDGAVRYNSAAITLEIARGLRWLVTSYADIPLDVLSPEARDFTEFIYPQNRFRIAPERELPLGRKLTEEDVAKLKTLQKNIREFVVQPSLKVFQAFRNAAPSWPVWSSMPTLTSACARAGAGTAGAGPQPGSLPRGRPEPEVQGSRAGKRAREREQVPGSRGGRSRCSQGCQAPTPGRALPGTDGHD